MEWRTPPPQNGSLGYSMYGGCKCWWSYLIRMHIMTRKGLWACHPNRSLRGCLSRVSFTSFIEKSKWINISHSNMAQKIYKWEITTYQIFTNLYKNNVFLRPTLTPSSTPPAFSPTRWSPSASVADPSAREPKGQSSASKMGMICCRGSQLTLKKNKQTNKQTNKQAKTPHMFNCEVWHYFETWTKNNEFPQGGWICWHCLILPMLIFYSPFNKIWGKFIIGNHRCERNVRNYHSSQLGRKPSGTEIWRIPSSAPHGSFIILIPKTKVQDQVVQLFS